MSAATVSPKGLASIEAPLRRRVWLMADLPQFLYYFVPRDRPELMTDMDSWTEADERIAEAHFAHLQTAAEAGIVIMAGRSQDGIGPAIVILEAEDEAAAHAFMQSDPFVAEGLFGASLHPFRVALQRKA